GNGCGNGSLFSNNGNCACSIIWIILLLSICGNNGCGCDNNCGNGCGNNSCLWIILLLLFCGDGCGCIF
ncbi:MAG: hypothetical protein Q4F83_14555, partial [Eubacteriales bacterium]|nr:hypothetical protein [Eubacteriales bacterium]